MRRYDSQYDKESDNGSEDMMEITTSVKEHEWKYFLNNCIGSSIYHTPEWKRFLQKTFGYEPHYLFSRDVNGDINGLLPLFYIKSRLTGSRLCSVPLSHICGHIGSDDSKEELVGEGLNLYSNLNAKYFEIRDFLDWSSFQPQNLFSTHILELCPNVDGTWSKLSRDVKRGIEKTKKNEIQVDSTNKTEDLNEFYELNCITKKEIGVPCHPWRFFKNMFELLDGYVTLYIARYNNEIIAGGVFEYFNNEVIYGYGAAHPDYLKFYPYNAFLWRSIEDACIGGYRYFDFGRTSNDNIGLINFKKRWGTMEKKLCYCYYPKNPTTLTGNRDNIKYKLGTKVIRKMPINIYRMFSDIAFGSFG